MRCAIHSVPLQTEDKLLSRQDQRCCGLGALATVLTVSLSLRILESFSPIVNAQCHMTKLASPVAVGFDNFGYAVASDGQWLIAGSPARIATTK